MECNVINMKKFTHTAEPLMSNDSKLEQTEVWFKMEKNMPRWSNKLSEFERIRTEPDKPCCSRLSALWTATERVSRTVYRTVFVLFHYIRPLQPLTMGPKKSSSNSTKKSCSHNFSLFEKGNNCEVREWCSCVRCCC